METHEHHARVGGLTPRPASKDAREQINNITEEINNDNVIDKPKK